MSQLISKLIFISAHFQIYTDVTNPSTLCVTNAALNDFVYMYCTYVFVVILVVTNPCCNGVVTVPFSVQEGVDHLHRHIHAIHIL